MNFEEIGHTVALLENKDEKDRKKWKSLYLTDKPKDCSAPFRELKLKDKPSLRFQNMPDKQVERSIRYVTGASGSGKSYWTKAYADEYHRMYPKREVYLISSLTDDPTIDKIKNLHRIKLNDDFLREAVTAEDFKDCMLIFDDTDCLINKNMKTKVEGILNSVLETGRHFNVEVIYTSHLACDGRATRRILNECKSITIFPSGLGGKSLRYLLDNYLGLDKEQCKRIKHINSRWVTISKTFPMNVTSEKEAFILNDHEDDD